MKTEKELLKIAEKVYHQYNENRYPKAIKLFKELLQNYPKNIEGWRMLSTMQSANKDFDDALKSINQAIELDPENIWSVKQKSLLFSKLSRLEYDGSKYFDEDSDGFYTIDSFENKSEILKAYIKHLYIQIDTFNEEDDIHEIYEETGNILSDLGKHEESIKDYKKALEFLDNSNEVFDDGIFNPYQTLNFNISKSYEKTEDFDNAIVYLDKAIQYDSENSYLLTHKAKVYDKKGDTEKKINVYNLFLENSEKAFHTSQDAVYLFHKIDTYIELKNLDKANDELSRIEKLEAIKHYSEAISEYKVKLDNLKNKQH
ncbi:tetratricopeptide repeat protein [Tenacibaculum agarivorans]|uniref:tetratricopeptide repeat protein n=1 Tax=Tenacibaculum agarivorans TaxID=1908389 RepID=UPI00094BC158|nr:tetratricopeptide repeat protein [Tenacibaculum agarivorans]